MIDSLRVRLVGATLATVSLGLVAAAVMAPFDSREVMALPQMLDEPYQDFLVMIPLGLLATVLTWLVSEWSLRHVRRASMAAASLGPDDLQTRVSLHGLPSEIRPLVEAFNGTLDRLSEAYLAERRFIADAAHELRTPLAVLSLRLQRAEEGAVDWAAIDREVVAVGRLTAQLLDLARKDHLARLCDRAELSAVDLARLMREVAATSVPLAEASGRELEVDGPDRLMVAGRADDLRDLIGNLLDNALLHGGGTVSLRCGEARHGGGATVWLSVQDEGAGIPSGLEGAIFDRFRKLDPNGPGHGLGLAIVRETLRGLGGRVAVVPGPGCCVRVELPPFGTQSAFAFGEFAPPFNR